MKLLDDKYLSHSDFKTNNLLVRANGDVIVADFGCVCSTKAATIGYEDSVVPLGDLGERRHAWSRKRAHSHPVARTSFCTSIADMHAFIVMACEVLYGYGPHFEVDRVVRTQKLFLADRARESDVHGVLSCFVDVAGTVLMGNGAFNLDRFIDACNKASGPLVPLEMQ